MPIPLCRLLAVAIGLAVCGAHPAGAASSAIISGTNCRAFPANSWWHADVSALKKHPRSDAWMRNMHPERTLHPDFGPSFDEIPGPYGIPITIVDGDHPKVRVQFDYADESDRRPYPLGDDTKVEGWDYDAPGDKHTITIDRSTCRLYETWDTRRRGQRWLAGSGAVWSLGSNRLRPLGWTSADAAGLPILPGLLRLDEVKRGRVDHAIRFTTDVTDRSFLWPARHHAGSVTDPDFPPMGARFRLKKSFRIDPALRADTKVILRAMKTYGLVLADNGSPWYFQGTAEEGWPEDLIAELKTIPAAAFEAVDTLPLKISDDSMRVRPRR